MKSEMKELIDIQSGLKCPKKQRNNFGGYNFRNCEDIMEAVKPLLKETGCTLTCSDELVMVGDRYYVRATARIVNSSGEIVETTAYAREEETKKGMDASQITGASSSYARKYALNGLLCIDDTKDSDTTNTGAHEEKTAKTATSQPKPAQKPAAGNPTFDNIDPNSLAGEKMREWIDKIQAAVSIDEIHTIYKDAPKAFKGNGTEFYNACIKKQEELKAAKK